MPAFTEVPPSVLESSSGVVEKAIEEPQTSQEGSSESNLSSALAAFGNYQPPSPRPESPVAQYQAGVDAQRQEQEKPPLEEPSWLAQLGATPNRVTSNVAREVARQEIVAEETPQADVVAPPPVTPAMTHARPNSLPVTPSAPRMENTFVSDFQPNSRLIEHPSEQAPAHKPAARVNPLLDNELETTMKRPAVRLQPMQQRVNTHDLGLPQPSAKARGNERAVPRAADGENVGYRERLVSGYQAQLVGDFDNAMQEYRIIIRNAPELLSEVVSNVRALLKLAPKYSAGYRVLGDAYMRQGEYLQAMEAYNKALTMAKKAKS
jgi:tetratricopeptide (TPR) repeat protein